MPASASTAHDSTAYDTVRTLQQRIQAMQAVSLDSRALPTAQALRPLLPGGALKAGVAYSVHGSASLAMLMLAGPSAAGAWCGVVGMPEFGIEAAAQHGIDLARLVLVPDPGAHWLTVTAQLADVLNVVLVQPPGQATASDMARLASRLRQRGACMVVLGDWPQAEATLEILSSSWAGLTSGSGYLAGREVVVGVSSRGMPRQRHPLRLADAAVQIATTATVLPDDGVARVSPARAAPRHLEAV